MKTKYTSWVLADGTIKMLLVKKLLIAIVMITLSAHAMADNDQYQARQLVKSGDILPLEVILGKHPAIAPGEILEIELEMKHGQPVYEIEWLDAGGQVREWIFDARSGERINQERD